uniref:Cytochrome b5 heme-binding domain-containing protein n=1 Tax=Aplanochytrium stocchinoi TaxID=215587 RepID=A0A7S3LNJ1_9STRA
MFTQIFAKRTRLGGLVLSASIGASFLTFDRLTELRYQDVDEKRNKFYTQKEVSERDGTKGKPLWVTYKDGVYDVTQFQKEHPGGKFLKQAAGGDVEVFWKKWSYHFSSPKLQNILEETRIGTVSDYDEKLSAQIDDPYVREPKRNLRLHKIFDFKPFCTETFPHVLNSSYLTQADALYVRNHAPVPEYDDPAEHEIAFSNESVEQCVLLDDILSEYPKVSVISVLQCAGNRTSRDAKASGPNAFSGTIFEDIKDGMVGNVLWEGIRLSSVLNRIFPQECAAEQSSANLMWHVIFEGDDEYETSTPLAHVLKASNDCILATKMNGKPLTPDHGYPVRAILPGVAGARNVKWLKSIRLSREPSDSPWNQNYYRKADGSHIQKLRMQSIILSPEEGETITCNRHDDKIHIKGVAYGVDSSVCKVEVSIDGGFNWMEATLLTDEILKDDSVGSYHGWVRFVADVDAGTIKDKAIVEICALARATDSNGNVQPQVSTKQRGYLYNGWSIVQFKRVKN